MKAIHNLIKQVPPPTSVGNYKLKYNFESNSQQNDAGVEPDWVGNYKLKYNFESNSQPFGNNIEPGTVGNYKLKYNFESNSQQESRDAVSSIVWNI